MAYSSALVMVLLVLLLVAVLTGMQLVQQTPWLQLLAGRCSTNHNIEVTRTSSQHWLEG